MMLVFYKFIFYKLYKWNDKLFGKADLPHWNGFLLASMMLLFNIFTALWSIDLFFDTEVADRLNAVRSIFILILLVYLFGNYLFFLRNDQYLKILERFDNMDRKKKRYLEIGFWAYIFLSVLSLSLVIFWTVQLNQASM